MADLSRFISPGILYLLTLVFGFWLSSKGKPYPGILFNIHKLVALGAVVVAGIQFSQMLNTNNPTAVIIALLVVAALCIVALFTSGALMSMGKLDYNRTLTIHRIAPVVLAGAMALAVYVLARQI
jgi:chromate transport protein ChrA